jgi:Gpi18-like mannosyltransferase
VTDAVSCRALFVAATVLALALRLAWLPVVSSDMTHYLLPWLDSIVAGGHRALGAEFSDYTPFYTYLLLIASWFDGLLPRVWLIKLVALPFDFFAALTMARLVAHFAGSDRPVLDDPSALGAYTAVLFAPTVALNGAAWGQSDVIHASALLYAFLMLCRNRPLPAMIAFGFAVSVKLQAAFLAPFLLFLILRRRIEPWHLLAAPLPYVLLALPAAVMGRPLIDLALIYVEQGHKWTSLSMGAPNPWLLVPNDFYEPGVAIGLALAAAVGLAFAILSARARSLDPRTLIVSATLCLALMPFVLPKMHDRYWFGAELFAIGLAFAFPRLLLVPILLQASAVQTYAIFLLEPHGLQKDLLIYSALLINTATIGMLALSWFHVLSQAGRLEPAPAGRPPPRPNPIARWLRGSPRRARDRSAASARSAMSESRARPGTRRPDAETPRVMTSCGTGPPGSDRTAADWRRMPSSSG